VLAERLRQLIEAHPTYGYRRLWALLRFGAGVRVNRKAVYPVLQLKGWFVHQRTVTPAPVFKGSRTGRSGDTVFLCQAIWFKYSRSTGDHRAVGTTAPPATGEKIGARTNGRRCLAIL
jgi:hypothetical protein